MRLSPAQLAALVEGLDWSTGARAADRTAAGDSLSPRQSESGWPKERARHAGIWSNPGAMTMADALPEDMPGLRTVALALIAERDELLRRIERMHHTIRQFQLAQFGRHSERLDPDQLQLALEEREIATAAHAEIAKAVTAARDICNPYRAAEARRQPGKRQRSPRMRR